jgi:hypothetical protein
MATLVFSTVGTIFGGPIGGAIGSLVGRQVDAALFGGSGRQGPRLKELAVTTSSYGQPIPRHFGKMRVAGSIIWATDLVEHSEAQGGGKGGPSVTTFSYTANFAVALSSRPITGVGRIWADGKLLRGEAGDLKTGGTLRVYTGEGDQMPDPLIAEQEGPGRCPAHRGLAYVVFEDLDLSEYYNHIPALTFEVIADTAFTLQDVIGEVIDEIDANVPLEGIDGFSSEASLAEALHQLEQIVPLETDAGGTALTIARARLQDAPIALPPAAIATGDGDFGAVAGYSRRRSPAPEAAPTVLRYHDTGRDYLPGIQRASGRAVAGEPQTIELSAALSAATARAIIERTARQQDWSRDRISWRTQELDAAISPGAIVTLPGHSGRWRVTAWEWRDTGVELALERLPPPVAESEGDWVADAGRLSPPQDLPPAETRLIAYELPWDGTSGTGDRPALFAAVSATSANWSGAAIYVDSGDGNLVPLGTSGRTRSIIGLALDALPSASAHLFDRASQITVLLAAPDLSLQPASTLQLANGANLALIGSELIQFTKAESLGENRWRLSGILRARGGTEDAIGTHAAGEPFVLLDGKAVALDAAVVGNAPERQIVAIGRGDAEPVVSPVAMPGQTLRPLSPVHPRAQSQPDGSLSLGWTRRARGGWQWRDGVDLPLGEESERYLVSFGTAGASLTTWETNGPSLDVAAATLEALVAMLPSGTFQVRQQGTHALSRPLALSTQT